MEAMLLWGLGLMGAALLLVIIEVFLPTAGTLAMTALVLAIAGVVCLFRVSTSWGLVGSTVVVFGGPALFFFSLHIMPHTPLGRRLVLGGDAPDEEGQGARASKAVDTYAGLVGAEGVVLTDLRPVGTIRIGDQKFDALAETTLIRAGTKVRVASVDGTTVKVRAIA